jgi:hypothetical protein
MSLDFPTAESPNSMIFMSAGFGLFIGCDVWDSRTLSDFEKSESAQLDRFLARSHTVTRHY